MTDTPPTATVTPTAKRTRGKAAPTPPPTTPAAKRKLFLATLAETSNVAQSARVAGMPVSTLYRQRGASPAFAAQWHEAREAAADALEAVLFRRALEGVERPVVYGGKQVGTVRNYSDALAMFMLRRLRPTGDGDRVETDRPDAVAPVGRAEVERRLTRLRETTANPYGDEPATDDAR